MRDAVGEVLAQRRSLERDAGVGIALSVLIHALVAGAAVVAALHRPHEESVPVIDIQFAKMPAPAPAAPAPVVPKAAPAPVPAPVVPAPQPVVKPAAKTVPLSPP